MKLNTEHGSIEVNASNAVILTYTNDMANGMFIDMGETYAFIHADSEAYPEVATLAVEEGIQILDHTEDIDWRIYPHNHVLQSLTRFIINAAETLIE
jgi:hypothetical protein